MSKRGLVCILCDPLHESDIADRVEQSNLTIDIWFSEQDGVAEAAEEAVQYNSTAFVVVDGARGARDEDVVKAARFLAGTETGMVFSSSTMARSWPSRLGAELVDAGCTNLAVALDAEPHAWLDVLIGRLAEPMGPEEAEGLCLRQRHAEDGTRADEDEAEGQEEAARPAKARQPLMPDSRPSAFAMSKRIGVCQCMPREGSTHLAIAISRVLVMAGMRVACVVPAKHVASLHKMFRKAPYDETLGKVTVSGIDFFEGTLPSAVPTSVSPEEDYDVVVTDFDRIDWFSKADSVAAMERMERRRDAFTHSDVRILSSFLDPAGAWNARNKYFDHIPSRELKKMTFAVYGLSDQGLDTHYRNLLASSGLNPRKLVTVEPMSLPIVARDYSSVCPGAIRLAGEVLPAKERAALLEAAEVDHDRAAREAQAECLALLEARGLSTTTAELAGVRTFADAVMLVDEVARRDAFSKGSDISEIDESAVRALVEQVLGAPVEDWDVPGNARMLRVAKALDARGEWDPAAVEAVRGMTDAEADAVAAKVASGLDWRPEEPEEKPRGLRGVFGRRRK